MRPLVYYIASTLDGFIAGESDDVSGFVYEGDHMATLLEKFADTIPTHFHRALGLTPDGSRFDTVIMGWSTYAFGLPDGITEPWRHLRQYVASGHERTLPSGMTLTDDPALTVRALKAESTGSGIFLAGGGTLAGALIDEIDHIVLKVNPVSLGTGVKLFGHAACDWRQFTRTSCRAFESGVTMLEFTRLRD